MAHLNIFIETARYKFNLLLLLLFIILMVNVLLESNETPQQIFLFWTFLSFVVFLYRLNWQVPLKDRQNPI